MASTYLRYTEGTSATDGKKFTFSTWVKRSYLGTDQCIFYNYINGSNFAQIYFRGSQRDIRYFDRVSGGDTCVGTTSPMLFNDVGGWYNIVLKVDTTQSASADKVQFYINGEYLAFNFDNVPSTDQVLSLSGAGIRTIGADNSGGNDFNGLMSYVALIDGTAESANIFGETDTTTGQWKIKTTITPTSSWGNTGFWILKDGNSVTDQSGNSNNFTVSAGNFTKTEDNPSNVFATWNYLSTVGFYKQAGYIDFYNGSTKIAEAGGNHKNTTSTIGAFTGKYYFETKMGTLNNSLQYSNYVGVITATDQASIGDNYNHVGQTANSVGYNSYNGQVFTSDSGTSYGSALATGDILCVALDVTNKKVYFRKNADAWFNSGNPESGATGTGAVSLPTTGDAWLFGGSPVNSSIESNFGNGYFGITAVSSAGTNASGNGIFEFDVPAGYTALSTKGLNL